MVVKIAVVGLQCAGKTTLIKYLGEVIKQRFQNEVSVKSLKFANPLYAINNVLGVSKNRAFMQEQSDLIKKHFGGDTFFIENFSKKEKFLKEEFGTPLCLLNDDCRYENEIKYMQREGWYLVYIHARVLIREERAKTLKLDFLPDHNSEQTDQISIRYEGIVDNSFITKEELECKARMLVAGALSWVQH